MSDGIGQPAVRRLQWHDGKLWLAGVWETGVDATNLAEGQTNEKWHLWTWSPEDGYQVVAHFHAADGGAGPNGVINDFTWLPDGRLVVVGRVHPGRQPGRQPVPQRQRARRVRPRRTRPRRLAPARPRADQRHHQPRRLAPVRRLRPAGQRPVPGRLLRGRAVRAAAALERLPPLRPRHRHVRGDPGRSGRRAPARAPHPRRHVHVAVDHLPRRQLALRGRQRPRPRAHDLDGVLLDRLRGLARGRRLDPVPGRVPERRRRRQGRGHPGHRRRLHRLRRGGGPRLPGRRRRRLPLRLLRRGPRPGAAARHRQVGRRAAGLGRPHRPRRRGARLLQRREGGGRARLLRRRLRRSPHRRRLLRRLPRRHAGARRDRVRPGHRHLEPAGLRPVEPRHARDPADDERRRRLLRRRLQLHRHRELRQQRAGRGRSPGTSRAGTPRSTSWRTRRSSPTATRRTRRTSSRPARPRAPSTGRAPSRRRRAATPAPSPA